MSDSAPRIKFCGVTNVADAELVAQAGAWALGMIFWRGSARRCRSAAAAEITRELRRRVKLVGVFVNASLDRVVETAAALDLDMVQLHGDEGPAYCAEVARRGGVQVIKATRVHSGADIQALGQFHTDFHLLDSHTPGLRGGSGETFSWELAAGHHGRTPVILSGGLKPDNVAAGIAAVRPYAVDVASGVERSPGIKDSDRLRAFADAVRGTASPREATVA